MRSHRGSGHSPVENNVTQLCGHGVSGGGDGFGGGGRGCGGGGCGGLGAWRGGGGGGGGGHISCGGPMLHFSVRGPASSVV